MKIYHLLVSTLALGTSALAFPQALPPSTNEVANAQNRELYVESLYTSLESVTRKPGVNIVLVDNLTGTERRSRCQLMLLTTWQTRLGYCRGRTGEDDSLSIFQTNFYFRIHDKQPGATTQDLPRSDFTINFWRGNEANWLATLEVQFTDLTYSVRIPDRNNRNNLTTYRRWTVPVTDPKRTIELTKRGDAP